jgi:hypothetical protein
MERWQEEWERKQAEFMHCIRSYDKMSNMGQAFKVKSQPRSCSVCMQEVGYVLEDETNCARKVQLSQIYKSSAPRSANSC